MQIDQLAINEDQLYRKVALRLMPFLLCCYLMAYLDRVNVGFAKLQMLGELKLTSTAYGLGAGLFFIGYVLLEVPSNIILHRVGARLWIARIMITWSLLSAATAFVHTPMQFYVLRFFLGVAEAGFIPGVLLYLTYWFPAERRGRMNGIFLAALPLSAIVGGPISGWILSALSGAHGLSGWRWLFLIEAAPSLALGVVTLFFLNDRIIDAKWLSSQEKQTLLNNVAREDKEKEGLSELSVAFRTPRVWLLGLIFFCIASGNNLISFWMPTVVSQTKVSNPMFIGMLAAVPSIAAVFAMIMVSSHADRVNERRWHTAIPMACAGVGLSITAYAGHEITIAMVGLVIAAASAASALASFWSLPAGFLSGSAAAAGIALVNSIGNLSGFTSTFLVGWIADVTGSTSPSLYLFACFLVAGGALIVLLPARPVPQEAGSAKYGRQARASGD